jgi:hypothetical protein
MKVAGGNAVHQIVWRGGNLTSWGEFLGKSFISSHFVLPI